jgi:hypothetical protein
VCYGGFRTKAWARQHPTVVIQDFGAAGRRRARQEMLPS